MAPRVDPDAVRAARLRLEALTAHDGLSRHATRRTAGRRARHNDADRADMAALSDAAVLTATDPDRLDRLALLAAAIDLAGDIAAVIDRAGRAQLEEVLGPELRRLAVSARKRAGPRQMLTGPALLETLEMERRLAMDLWRDGLPAPLRADQDPSTTTTAPDALRDRLQTALGHAEALLAGEPQEPESDKELAA